MAALGAIEEDLSCSYCLDLFVEPQQLECGHNLCRKCVETMTAFALARLNAPESLPVTALKRSGKLEVEGSPAAAPAAAAPDPLTCIECPLCRATSRFSTLKVNINLKNLSEAARARKQETSVLCSVCDGTPNKAEADCVNCGFSFCSNCLEPHKKQIYRSHVLQPAGFLAKQSPVRMCSVPSHSTKPVELICKQCDAIVCFTCAQFGKHKGHDCESFDEAVEKKSAEMKGLIEQVAKLTQDIDVTQSKLADELKTQNEVHSRLRERLVDHFDALLRRASRMKEELVAQLDEAIESTDTICNDHNKSLLSVSARAKAVAESAKSFSSNVDVQNPLPAMQRCVQLLGLVKELQAVNLKTSYQSPVQLSIAEDLSALNDFGVSLRFRDPATEVLPNCTIADSKSLEPLLRFLSIRMPGRKYSLVYRGSRDGFDANAFHSKCKNIGPTLTIARSRTGYVFGAYCSVPWRGSGAYIADSQAFLFSVNGGSNRSFLVSDSYQDIGNSVHDNAHYGPSFGRNRDLRIQGNTAYCNVGHSYCVPPGESNTYLFGASQAVVTELMVYSVATEPVDIQVPTNRVSDEIAKFVCAWFSSFGFAVKSTDPLYSSTRDGRSNNMFHAKCDNKGPTFTVVFTATGHIFGGFTNTSWMSNGAYGSDPRAFLFLLHDGASKRWLFQRHCVTRQQQANFNHASYGPTFGGGHDLHIHLDNPGSSYVNIQHSYDATGFSHALCGGRNGWNILEVRVYAAQPSSFVPSV